MVHETKTTQHSATCAFFITSFKILQTYLWVPLCILRTYQNMYKFIILQFKEHTIYFSHFMDFRGRCYPIANGHLSHQGCSAYLWLLCLQHKLHNLRILYYLHLLTLVQFCSMRMNSVVSCSSEYFLLFVGRFPFSLYCTYTDAFIFHFLFCVLQLMSLYSIWRGTFRIIHT